MKKAVEFLYWRIVQSSVISPFTLPSRKLRDKLNAQKKKKKKNRTWAVSLTCVPWLVASHIFLAIGFYFFNHLYLL